MKEFTVVENPTIVGHTIIVVLENDDRHNFKPTVVNDPHMSTALIRDIAKFFLLGKVKGRFIHPVYPLEANNDKPGVFAKTARETAAGVIKMHSLANDEDKTALESSLPILNFLEAFPYDDVKQAMVALHLMGHHEEAIFFMFMHFMNCEVWP